MISTILRELLDEHCSYCIPAGRQKSLVPTRLSRAWQKSAGYCRRLDTHNDYHDLIDHLREKHEKVNRYKPQSWFDTFHGRETQHQERQEDLNEEIGGSLIGTGSSEP